MCVHTEPEIWLARPVLQVVGRLVTRTSEVRNLVLGDTGSVQAFARMLVKIGGKVFVGNEMSVILRASRDQFASQS